MYEIFFIGKKYFWKFYKVINYCSINYNFRDISIYNQYLPLDYNPIIKKHLLELASKENNKELSTLLKIKGSTLYDPCYTDFLKDLRKKSTNNYEHIAISRMISPIYKGIDNISYYPWKGDIITLFRLCTLMSNKDRETLIYGVNYPIIQEKFRDLHYIDHILPFDYSYIFEFYYYHMYVDTLKNLFNTLDDSILIEKINMLDINSKDFKRYLFAYLAFKKSEFCSISNRKKFFPDESYLNKDKRLEGLLENEITFTGKKFTSYNESQYLKYLKKDF